MSKIRVHLPIHYSNQSKWSWRE